jgi:hypothetical protein
MDMSYQPSGKGIITGKGAGDFEFLTGEWRIANRRLKDGTKDQWEELPGEATVFSVMSGQVSIEELRIPVGSHRGMGLRVWRPKEKKWTDHWTGTWNGVVNEPQLGEFIDGEGIFIGQETADGKTTQYRGVWDKITANGCRWHQSASTDGGKSWTWNWWMEWTRVS